MQLAEVEWRQVRGSCEGTIIFIVETGCTTKTIGAAALTLARQWKRGRYGPATPRSVWAVVSVRGIVVLRVASLTRSEVARVKLGGAYSLLIQWQCGNPHRFWRSMVASI